MASHNSSHCGIRWHLTAPLGVSRAPPTQISISVYRMMILKAIAVAGYVFWITAVTVYVTLKVLEAW